MDKFLVTMYVSAPDRETADDAIAQMVNAKEDIDVSVDNWIVDDGE